MTPIGLPTPVCLMIALYLYAKLCPSLSYEIPQIWICYMQVQVQLAFGFGRGQNMAEAYSADPATLLGLICPCSTLLTHICHFTASYPPSAWLFPHRGCPSEFPTSAAYSSGATNVLYGTCSISDTESSTVAQRNLAQILHWLLLS